MIRNTLFRCAMGMAVAVVLGSVVEVSAALPTFNNTSGLAYSQNFDGLASSGTGNNWSDDSTLGGWFLKSSGGEWSDNASNQYRADSGGSGTEDFYSWGSSAADRALGSVPRASGTVQNPLAGRTYSTGLGLQYTGASALSQLQIIYTGEWWRDGVSGSRTLSFEYKVQAGAPAGSDYTSATGWTAVSQLNYTVTGDGSNAANMDGSQQFNHVITGLNITQNSYILLRWINQDVTGANDHGLAIDNVFVAVPEANTWAAGALLGAAALVGYRRSRRAVA